MRIQKRSKIAASTKSIKASTTGDMLEAFEDKLKDLRVNTSTEIDACGDIAATQKVIEGDKSVPIYDDDYNEYYVDTTGMFGQDEHSAGETYSLGEIKNYWNQNYDSDYILEEYETFQDWWDDTKQGMDPENF